MERKDIPQAIEAAKEIHKIVEEHLTEHPGDIAVAAASANLVITISILEILSEED